MLKSSFWHRQIGLCSMSWNSVVFCRPLFSPTIFENNWWQFFQLSQYINHFFDVFFIRRIMILIEDLIGLLAKPFCKWSHALLATCHRSRFAVYYKPRFQHDIIPTFPVAFLFFIFSFLHFVFGYVYIKHIVYLVNPFADVLNRLILEFLIYFFDFVI
jgi:hypothetical protein